MVQAVPVVLHPSWDGQEYSLYFRYLEILPLKKRRLHRHQKKNHPRTLSHQGQQIEVQKNHQPLRKQYFHQWSQYLYQQHHL